MKKSTFSKFLLIALLLFMGWEIHAQNYVPFVPRYDQAIKGDMLLIGNNNLSVHRSNAYNQDNGSNTNNESSGQKSRMVHVDIDNDNSTFNSSSANLKVPSNTGCYKVVYAALYWTAVVKGSTPMENIKFKIPGGSYQNITGEQIYYQASSNNKNSNAYVYYKDVTDIVADLSNAEGTYTVANISTMTSSDMRPNYNQEGLSAGWSLFVIYEDPLLPSKYITSFDGFTKIDNKGSNTEQTFLVDGFKTIPVGPVRAKYAFSALEGDKGWTGDFLEINGTKIGATMANGKVIRPTNNFFNSSVSVIDPLTDSPIPYTDRNPASTNTLGFDAGIINIPNGGNSIIGNGDTSATIRLGTNTDIYYFYFNAFAIEIIAPKIILTKTVENAAGIDIGNQEVDLGTELNYVLGFQNTGNDDTKDLIIRDVLPINIDFNYPQDIVELPVGVTHTYNAGTRELVFKVDNSIVEINDPLKEIRFKVTVVRECSKLNNACSNIISNQAYVTYKGTENPDFLITDDPSFSSNTGCLLTPGATNFLADITCDFEEEVILCGPSVTLTAGDGYDSYSWSTSPTGSPVIGTSQSITVKNTGTYYVHNTATAPCQSIDQRFVVVTYGENSVNPVLPFADEVVICPNDGKQLPNIFLCGANDVREIQTNITDTSSIIWEKLDEGSCTAVTNDNCANEDASCTWSEVATGPNFNAKLAGQYRVTLHYEGGCFSQYYFNVYSNILEPTATSRDITCSTLGKITVGGVPSGYEYSIDGVNYQSSNVFSIDTPGVYSVYVKQAGVNSNPCIFSVPDVQIRKRNFTGTAVVSQPLCHGEKGSVKLAAKDVEPQYFYSLSKGGTVVQDVGPVKESDYTFSNLNPGTYTATISTEDGCSETVTFEIVNPPLLTATSAITSPLDCSEGEITIYPKGGVAPYYYFVNGSTEFQSEPTIIVTEPGTYDVRIVDSNNCSTDTSIKIDAIPVPVLNVSTTDALCSDINSGVIKIGVMNSSASSLKFSIDGGATFVSSKVFSGLAEGDYEVMAQYTTGTSVCETEIQNVTITSAPAIEAVATLTAPFTCDTNGTITVSGVTGGSAPYSYSIDGINFQSSETFSNLTHGTYTIFVKDAVECSITTNEITIAPLNPPTDLEFGNSALTCPSNVSTVTITGTTGGVGTLQYQIVAPAASATAYQTSASFGDLAPGTYTFQVKDENDCTYSETFTIAPLPSLTMNTVLTKDLDCTINPDAVIAISVVGGAAPFSYAVSYNGGAYGAAVAATGANFNYTAASEGTYQIRITDANNCTVESGIETVTPISYPALSAVAQTQEILCNGESTGAIKVTVDPTTGVAPFALNIFNTTTGTDYGTQTSGLPAGTYTVTVTDAKSCEAIDTVIISEPDPIILDYQVIDISCDATGVSQGSIIINSVLGGTAPYNYHVTGTNGYNKSEFNTDGSTSVSFNVVSFGLYQINIVDANGCSVLEQDVLVASPPDDLVIAIETSVDCLNGGEAVVSVGTELASAGPFFFSIYQGPSSVYPNPPGSWLAEDAPGSKSATFTNLIPGVTYTFIVFDDATGCSYYETSTAPIPSNSTLTASAVSANNITCVGSADGNVSFTVNSIYTTSTTIDYEIFNSQSLNTTGITGTGTVPANGSLNITDLGPLAFGNYYVLIKETSGPFTGCSVVTVPFNITESAIALELATSIDQNANCNVNSGLISAVAKNGTAPYKYQITDTPAYSDSAWASASTFNKDAGDYYVHVKDAYGCIVTSPVVVLPMDPTPAISAISASDCDTLEGGFEIEVSLDTPGIAPYSFSINGGAFQTRTAPFTLTNLNSGTHTIEVKDANGCGNIVSVDLPAPLSLTPEVTTVPTCNDDDGVIEMTTTGGSGNYTYSISPNAASISISGDVFSGVPAGLYTITVTDTDTGCTEEVTVSLASPTQPTVSLTPITSVTCFGDNTGSFEIVVSNYTGSYSYQIFDNSGTPVSGIVATHTSTNPLLITGMEGGMYTVEITETDVPFCTATATVVIASPQSALALEVSETSNVTCDDNQGTITAIASGGWGSYEYELTGAATVAYSPNGTFTGLSAGVYTINVRDAEGCIASETVTLSLPDPIDAVFTPSHTLLSCFGDKNASITVSNVIGGEGVNYLYTLNTVLPTVSSSGPQTSPVFTGLGAGTYNVTITDAYNCSVTSGDIVISEPTPIEANLVAETSSTCLTDATLTLSASGGTGLYSYSTTSSFATVVGTFTSSTTFSVSPGTYKYYVRDANGCVAVVTNDIKIDPTPELEIMLTGTNLDINCFGDNNGAIVATAQGGLGNYVYTLLDASQNPIASAVQNSAGVFTELLAGTYYVKVDSGDCDEISDKIEITQPIAPLNVTASSLDVSCFGGNNGMIQIDATGGTGIIKYAISPQLNQFFENNVFENLAPGTYDVIVQDEVGCYEILTFTISQPDPVIVSIVPGSIIPEICYDENDGMFSIEISGGTAPYSVSLDDYDGPYITGAAAQTLFDFAGLKGGDHAVFVRDSEGCESEWNITLPESVKIEPVVVVDYLCDNNTPGNQVIVNVDASITDTSELDYSLNGGPYQSSNVFENVIAGVGHYIDVRHTNGCIQRTALFDINHVDVLELGLNDGGMNEIVAIATGGTGGYQFTLNGEDYGSTSSFIISKSGTYTVTVTDSSGCVATATRYFEYIDICIPNYFTPNGDNNQDTWAPGCAVNYPNLEFKIFDRYGREVGSYRQGQAWDGKYRERELPTGDYWYIVKLNDGKDDRDFVGHFTLYR